MRMQSYPLGCYCFGYTLLEVLVVAAVLSVLTGIGIPSYSAHLVKRQVALAAEGIYQLIQQAQTEGSVRDIDLSFNSMIDADTWCVGYAAAADCDCTNLESCFVDVAQSKVLQVLKSSAFNEVSLAENFPQGGGTRFDRIRGSASQAGTLRVNSGEYQLSVIVSKDGRVRICSSNDASDSISGYRPC